MARKGSGASRMDDFPQIMAGSVTESAAGTLTFSSRLETGYSLADNVGLIIHRIDYHIPNPKLILLLDQSDYITGGLVTSDQLTSLLLYGSNVVDFFELDDMDFGTPANACFPITQPIVKNDFTNLPGGGILVAPNPLFFCVQGISMSQTIQMNWRMYYTAVSLSDKGFRELWETWNTLRI